MIDIFLLILTLHDEQTLSSSDSCKTGEKPDGKPVEDLYDRNKAETKTEAAKSADVGDEFKTSHLL